MSIQRTSLIQVIRSVLLACLFGFTLSAEAAELRLAARPGEPVFFEVIAPSAGLLAVDVAGPIAASGAEPALAFVGRGCGTRADFRPQVIERSASHLVLAAPGPGSYRFEVASQDPKASLDDVKVRSGFASGGAVTKNGEDEEIIEIEPDPFTAPCGAAATKNGEDEEIIEIEPDPFTAPCGGAVTKNGEDEEIIEIEPDPQRAPCVAGGSRPLAVMLAELCRASQVDDHGDAFACASFLAPDRRVAGEIGNGWGDDSDVFEVFVGGPGSGDLFEVVVSAAGEVVGALYDRSGLRLETAAGDGGFRIARALPPGRYFLRVEGRDGAEGPYALSVAARPW